MTSVAFPGPVRFHTVSKSHTYGYACHLLGYGDTFYPTALEACKTRRMAAEIIKLLDHEGINQVHGVADDTGRPFFVGHMSGRAVLQPGEHFDPKAVNALRGQFLDYERFVYLEFFTRSDAGDILDQHHVGATGAMEAWLLQDKKTPEAGYVTEPERQTHQIIMRNGHTSCIKRERRAQEYVDPVLSMPVLMICLQPSKLEFTGCGRAEGMKQATKDFTFWRVSAAGHLGAAGGTG
ncbi:hypothetical protein BDW66DRAFT_156071 [Aspergillus desertorum]